MLYTKPTSRIYGEMTPEQSFLILQLLTKLQGDFDGTSIEEITYKINKWKDGIERKGPYKGRALMKNGAWNLRRKKKRRTHCMRINLS